MASYEQNQLTASCLFTLFLGKHFRQVTTTKCIFFARFYHIDSNSTIPILSESEISSFEPFAVVVQPGLCRTWSKERFSLDEAQLDILLIKLRLQGFFCYIFKCHLIYKSIDLSFIPSLINLH